jgi:hypothetical protein
VKNSIFFLIAFLSSCATVQPPKSIDTYVNPTVAHSNSTDVFCVAQNQLCQNNITEHGIRAECTLPPEGTAKNTAMFDKSEDGPGCIKSATAAGMGDGVGICTAIMCRMTCQDTWRLYTLLCAIQYEVSPGTQSETDKVLGR